MMLMAYASMLMYASTNKLTLLAYWSVHQRLNHVSSVHVTLLGIYLETFAN